MHKSSSESPGPSSAPISNTTNNDTTVSSLPSGKTKTYSAPAVFPNEPKFDWTVLDSPKFKDLIQVPKLTSDPSLLGRDNPFSSY